MNSIGSHAAPQGIHGCKEVVPVPFLLSSAVLLGIRHSICLFHHRPPLEGREGANSNVDAISDVSMCGGKEVVPLLYAYNHIVLQRSMPKLRPFHPRPTKGWDEKIQCEYNRRGQCLRW